MFRDEPISLNSVTNGTIHIIYLTNLINKNDSFADLPSDWWLNNLDSYLMIHSLKKLTPLLISLWITYLSRKCFGHNGLQSRQFSQNLILTASMQICGPRSVEVMKVTLENLALKLKRLSVHTFIRKQWMFLPINVSWTKLDCLKLMVYNTFILTPDDYN